MNDLQWWCPDGTPIPAEQVARLREHLSSGPLPQRQEPYDFGYLVQVNACEDTAVRTRAIEGPRDSVASGVAFEQQQETLKRLLDQAVPGGVVTVPKGRHTKPVEITEAVVLHGESQEGCVH